jgi:hypothetical protein
VEEFLGGRRVNEYFQRKADGERRKREEAHEARLDRLIDAVSGVTDDNRAANYEADRADRFHRRIETLTLKLERRKYWLEIAETGGLWFAAFVGVAAIVTATHDADRQTGVMSDQLQAMKGQLQEMKGTSGQTDKLLETNIKLAEASAKQAEAAIAAAKVARDSYVASQRAWIGPVDAHIAPLAAGPLKATVQYANTGREPAATLASITPKVFSYTDWNSGEAVRVLEAAKNDCLKAPLTDVGVRMTFPTSGFTTFNIGYDGTPQSIRDVGKIAITEEIMSGREMVAVHGCFVYRTVEEIHRTAFCFFYQAKVSDPNHLNFCTIGQAAN